MSEMRGASNQGVAQIAVVEEHIERVRAIRRRVRLASGRPDGRCGKVAEAIEAELGWAYRWGHLRLSDGGICWIHCWNQLPDGTVVDATADQFEERWLGDVVVLSPGEPLHTCYRSAPPGHLFRTVRTGCRRRLLARRAGSDRQFEPAEEELATAPDSRRGWIELGARAVEVHSGWRLPEWIGREAGDQLREAAANGEPLPSRELEFALDAAARERRIASHGEWTSPEWREGGTARAARGPAQGTGSGR
jgi:hypothetical protein